MANKDGAFGFRPVRHLTGGNILKNEYAIASGYGTAIYYGQCVKAVTAGGIESAAAGNVILGVFGGCFFTDPTTSKPTFSTYYPASTSASDIVAFVYDDPRIVFEVQHDGTGTAAMNFAGFDLTGTGGSTLTGRSTQELDTTTAGTSGQFKQIGISKDPDNSDTGSANANAYVIPNVAEHSYLLTTALS
tara:strand:- start:10 stop:576 length:567 start_codon:yes stop_codon:yes gene_type:complete